MEELKKLACQFRKAIEKATEKGEEGLFFREFPKGQCGNASDLLAQFLIDNGYSSIEYVCGNYDEHSEDKQSHAWLNVDGTVVDITGDQFKYHQKPLQNNRSVYVGPLDDFYKAFECHPADRHLHNGLEEWWPSYYEWSVIYETIIQCL